MNPVLITPAFVATQTDSGDPTTLGPDAWNAARLIGGGTVGDLIARDPSSPTGASWQAPAVRASPILAFDFSSTTTPPPTSSQVRFNAATPTATTALYVRFVTSDGMDAYWVLRNLAVGALVTIQDKNDHTVYAQFKVTNAAIDQGSHIEIPVAWVQNLGAFVNNQAILLLASSPASGGGLVKLASFAPPTPVPLPAATTPNDQAVLWTFALPANTLGVNGDLLYLAAYGQFETAGSGISRQLDLNVGAFFVDKVQSNGGQEGFFIDAYITRSGPAAQTAIARTIGPGVVSRPKVGTVDLTVGQTVTVTAAHESTPPGPALTLWSVLLWKF